MKTSLFLALTFLAGLVNAQTCRDYITNDWADSRYVNHNNGTIADKTTGLMWKQCVEGLSASDCATGTASAYTWQEALQIPLGLNSGSGFAKHHDWRLPNIKELRSLAAYNCYNPSINQAIFPNTPIDRLWSSSPRSNIFSNAWLLYFGYGSDGHDDLGSSYKVRLVRSGQ